MSAGARPPGRGDQLREVIRVLRIELGILNDTVARSAGLNPQDLDVLDVIDRDGPCTPGHLARRTGTSRATLTGVLSRLETDGWIAREQDPADRRSARVRPTDRFTELRALYAHADARVAELADGVPDAAWDEVIDLLSALAEQARQVGAGEE